MVGEGKGAARVTRIRPRCSACGKSVAARHRFCPHCGSPLAGTPTAGDGGDTAAAGQVLAGPSLQVSTARPDALEEQRKVVTVMFVDLTESTPIAERLDPEEWRGVLASYFKILSHEIERFGGTIDKYIGDAVMAVFGAPIAREDDPHRAISAALAIKAEMARENEELERRYGVRLKLRTGINTGEVVAGLLAGGAEGAYTVTGDTVNTAQRLEGSAPANEILVGEATYQLTRRAFVFEQLPPLTLKGKKEPVPAYRVIMRERRALPREGRSVFVGRAAEVALLQAFFKEASEGRGHVVHVHGEAGVGKSRLIQELFASLPAGVNRLRPRCTSYETGTPYALVADLVRRACRIQPGDEEDAAQRALFAGLQPLDLREDRDAFALFLEVLGYGERCRLDPESKRRLLVSSLRRFFRAQSERAPLVIVAEDAHWIDAASAAVLGEVLADVPSLRCLFISTSRDEAAPWPAQGVGLGPLDEATAAELLERVAATPLDPNVRAVVLERTAGNPFFLEEVVRSLGGRAAGTVPATVQELLQARLDDLDPDAKRVAQLAAVIGRTFSTRLLNRIGPDVMVDRSLAVLEAEGFIAPRPVGPEPSYAFRHALLQEAAYQVQLMAQRRSLHGVVGEAIEDLYAGRLEEFVDVLAFHYDRSEFDDKAVTWLTKAGDRAKRLFANDEAIQHLSRAAERARRNGGLNDRLPRILVELADVQDLVGNYDPALDLYSELRRDTHDVRAWRGFASVLRKRGKYAEALASIEEALLSEALKGEDLLPLKMEQGWTLAASRRLSEAVEVLRRALEDAARRRDPLVGQLLLQLARVEAEIGEFEAALEHALRARSIFEELEELRGLAAATRALGGAYYRLDRFDEAEEVLRRALQLAERVGSVEEVAASLVNLGMVELRRGALDEAIAYDRRAIAEVDRIGHQSGRANAYANLAEKLMHKGQYEEASAYCDKAIELAREIGRPLWVGDATETRARILLRQGQIAEAAAKAEEAAAIFLDIGAAPRAAKAYALAGEAWELAGNGERARDIAARARSLSPSH